MDWKLVAEKERAAMERIVALLLAFAGLAELAGRRSPAVGGFLLLILRHAEAVARDFVGGGLDTAPASMPAGPGCSPLESVRLAASFRALAWQLDRQARHRLAAGGEGGGRTEPLAFSRMPAMRQLLHAPSLLAGFAGRAPRLALAPDTS